MMKSLFRYVLLVILGVIGFGLLVWVDDVSGQTTNLEIYVARLEDQCSGLDQCFFDQPSVLALDEAIDYAKEKNLNTPNIHILAAYEIRADQVVVDYPVTIIGQDGGIFSTSSSDCSQPMLLITSNVTLRNLNIRDGGYCTGTTRDLIHVNSASLVTIEGSTLQNGANAIVHKNSPGSLAVRFNDIKNNTSSALTSENSDAASSLRMVANNIENNGGQPQVICGANGSVDHNFWGENIQPSVGSQGCAPNNSMVLGTRIVATSPGVGATFLTLSNNYPGSDFYGFTAKSNEQTSIYVVNHGVNQPFPDLSLKLMTTCGNYFDVFLAENSQPQSISLRFRYDRSPACQQAVQTMSLCGSGKPGTYPIMWLDPKTGVTKGWDNAGAPPEANVFFPGQPVICNTNSKTIEVTVDTDGRPDLQNDLHFTPFVVGFEISTIATFRPSESPAGTVNISWATNSEINTRAFRVSRSESADGVYTQIGDNIPATGASLSGKTYEIKDTGTVASTVYYYKLDVLEEDGTVQQTVGPVWISTIQATTTSRPTSTRVPTRTPTEFRTATNSFRSATPTFFTQTPGPTEEIFQTQTATALPDFNKPTSFQSTRTARPTQHPGQLLEKRDPGSSVLPGLFVGILITGVVAWFIIKFMGKKH